jgi:PAS domain S-box-containing protein
MGISAEVSSNPAFARRLSVAGRQQAALAALSRQALGRADLDALMDRTAAILAEVLEVEFSSVQVAADDRTLLLKAGRGWHENVVGKSRQVGVNSQCGYTFLLQKPVIVQDLRGEQRFRPLALLKYGVSSGVSVIIQGASKPFGVLAAFTTAAREFTEEEVNFLQSAANVLGLAIQNDDARQKLSHSEEQFRWLIQNGYDLTSTISLDGRIVSIGSSVERITGYRPEEVVGRNAFDLFGGANLTRRESVWRILTNPESLHMQRTTIRHRNGSKRVLEITGSWSGARGESRLAVFNSRDVTERVRSECKLRRSNARFKAVFDGSFDAIAIRSFENDRYIGVNSAFTELLGYAHDDVIGRTPAEIGLIQSDRELKPFSEKIAATGRVRDCEYDLRANNDTMVTAQISSVLMPMEGGRVTVSFIRDITARKRTEAELIRAHNAALKASRLKSAFLANTSHEIRTPLNIILGYSDLIADYLNERGDSQLKPYLEAVQRAGQRLTDTIEEILDYSKIESGTLELNPTEIALSPLMEGLINNLGILAATKGIALTCTIEEARATVRFDQHSLVGALTKLLQNAIKFTERGEVAMRLYRDQRGLELEIRDSGIGIDKDYLPYLFEPFSQEQSHYARPFEGSGLGLPLARRFLELNGATVELESEKGIGTTFTIHLRAVETGVAA